MPHRDDGRVHYPLQRSQLLARADVAAHAIDRTVDEPLARYIKHAARNGHFADEARHPYSTAQPLLCRAHS